MRDYYHTIAVDSMDRPAILGLTASPVVRSKPQELQTIENNLDAIAKTPVVHRNELLKHETAPTLVPIRYSHFLPGLQQSDRETAVQVIVRMTEGLSIDNDPYIKTLRTKAKAGDLRATNSIRRLLTSEKTYCQIQIKAFRNKAENLAEELGDWAVRYLIDSSLISLTNTVDQRVTTFGVEDEDEKLYLQTHVHKIAMELGPSSFSVQTTPDHTLSPKLRLLLDVLSESQSPSFSGLIFVERRITAAALSYFLSQHPLTSQHFRPGYAVGESSDPRRKHELGDMADQQSLVTTLHDFRKGAKNLIVCTNALEEGIDVPACQFVMCFNRPANLKSFIQKRGRARAKVSKFVVFVAEDDGWGRIDRWQELEREMIALYQDEERVTGEGGDEEAEDEDMEKESEYEALRVAKTG